MLIVWTSSQQLFSIIRRACEKKYQETQFKCDIKLSKMNCDYRVQLKYEIQGGKWFSW